MKESTKLTAGIIFVFLIFIIQPQSFAQSKTAFPRIEPDSNAVEYFNLSNKNNNLSWNDLAKISLWASGDLKFTSLDKIQSAVEKLKNEADIPANNKDKAEFILTFMHKNYFKAYSLYQTRVDTIFSNGRFNCVSSAVLYMIFCQSMNIKTSGVVTKEHAFITVHTGSEDIDVETTNAYGFDPGKKKEFLDQKGSVTGFSYVPAHNYRDRQTINQIELISLIMNNLIAEFERQNKFADAVPVSIDRAALLCGRRTTIDDAAVNRQDSIFKDPVNELHDRLFNYGSTLIKAGKEDECLRWAAFISPLYPNDKWQEVTLAAINNQIVKLIKANKISDAVIFLENNKSLLSQKDYSSFDSILIDNELIANVNKIRNSTDSDIVVNAAFKAYTDKRITEKRAMEIITYSVQKTASVLGGAPSRNNRAAAEYIESAISRFGSNKDLENALKIYKDNIAADYHNRFASEWNKKNYSEAERVIKDGLVEFPNNRQLLADMETINKNR